MARIIPWKLPEVAGGSIGGYTPAPTPEPVNNDPYDLDDLLADAELKAYLQFSGQTLAPSDSYNIFTYLNVSISGVKIQDVAEVGSVIAIVTIPKDTTLTVSYTNYQNVSKTIDFVTSSDTTFNVDIANVMTPSGGDATGYLTANAYIPPGGYISLGDMSDVKVNNDPTYTPVTIPITKIVAYNSNGVPLQEWIPGE